MMQPQTDTSKAARHRVHSHFTALKLLLGSDVGQGRAVCVSVGVCERVCEGTRTGTDHLLATGRN